MGVQGAFVLVIFNKKMSMKRLLLFSLILGSVSQLMRLMLPEFMVTLNLVVYILLMGLAFRFIFAFRIYETVLGISLTLVLTAFAEYSSTSVAKLLLRESFNELMQLNNFFAVVIVQNTATFFGLVLVLVIAYLKFRIQLPSEASKRRLLGITSNGLVTAIVMVPNMIYIVNSNYKNSVSIFIFNSISVLVMFLMSIFNSLKHGELEAKKQEVEYQKQYIETLNHVIDGLRGFKHDYNNMVQVIGGYLALDDLEGLRRFHFHMQKESISINSVAPINTYLKENPALYGLVLSKFTYSEVKNVIFQSSITTQINFSAINSYDFCKVLGILLDNAIEAAEESEKRQVDFHIRDDSNGKGVIVEIGNTVSAPVEEEDIFKDGFSTKEGHSGFGLWEVKKIVARYRNWTLETKIYERYFRQRIIIGH